MCDKKFCDGNCDESSCVGNGGKKCKGIKQFVVKKGITIEDCKDCIFNRETKTIMQTCFRTHKHEMFTEQINKVALSPGDDKRVILLDGIKTLPIGHWRTKHPILNNIEINIKKLSEKDSLMNLAYNTIKN